MTRQCVIVGYRWSTQQETDPPPLGVTELTHTLQFEKKSKTLLQNLSFASIVPQYART